MLQATSTLPTPAPSPSPPIGRTWPDVVADLLREHTGAGILLLLFGALLFVVAVVALFALVSYLRAGKRGTSWKLLWGAVEHGAPEEAARTAAGGPGDRPPPASSALPLPAVAKAAAQFIEVIPEVVAATRDADLDRAEGRLLHALLHNTQQSRAVVRRAAIFRVEPRGSDQVMVLQRGFPERAFSGRPEFAFSTYLQDRKGLCWKAALQAQAVRRVRPGARAGVLAVSRVREDPEFLARPGEHRFESILIGPILARTEILGAICLDSEHTDFYDDDDKQTVALASLAMEAAWVLRAPRPPRP
jgi:hypothetical protein